MQMAKIDNRQTTKHLLKMTFFKRVSVGILLVFLFAGCSGEAEQNFDDLQKIQSGMTAAQVRKVMTNNPESVQEAYWNPGLFVYFYKSPPAASDHYQVIFNKADSTVVEVNFGD